MIDVFRNYQVLQQNWRKSLGYQADGHCKYRQEEQSLNERFPGFLLPLFSVTTAYYHLQPHTESETKHIDRPKPDPGKGGCAKFHITYMPEKQGIGNVYQLFDKDAHHYRKSDEPNFLICIIHLFKSI